MKTLFWKIRTILVKWLIGQMPVVANVKFSDENDALLSFGDKKHWMVFNNIFDGAHGAKYIIARRGQGG